MNQEETFEQLIKIIEKLGWSLALPNTNDEEEVKGMIIGTEDYIDYILNGDHIEFDC